MDTNEYSKFSILFLSIFKPNNVPQIYDQANIVRLHDQGAGQL